MKNLKVILLALAVSLTSCVKEAGMQHEGSRQALMDKLVGDPTCADNVSSILVFIDGDIDEFTASETGKGLEIQPVFRNSASRTAQKHNLHKWHSV